MIEKVLDYNTLTDRDKKIVEEVLNNLPTVEPAYKELIKVKFRIKEIPEYDCKELYDKLKDIGFTVQGFRIDGGIKYPMLSVCNEARDFEKLLNIKNDWFMVSELCI